MLSALLRVPEVNCQATREGSRRCHQSNWWGLQRVAGGALAKAITDDQRLPAMRHEMLRKRRHYSRSPALPREFLQQNQRKGYGARAISAVPHPRHFAAPAGHGKLVDNEQQRSPLHFLDGLAKHRYRHSGSLHLSEGRTGIDQLDVAGEPARSKDPERISREGPAPRP